MRVLKGVGRYTGEDWAPGPLPGLWQVKQSPLAAVGLPLWTIVRWSPLRTIVSAQWPLSQCGHVVLVLWGVGVVGIVVVGPTGMGEARNHLPTCSLPDTRQRIDS